MSEARKTMLNVHDEYKTSGCPGSIYDFIPNAKPINTLIEVGVVMERVIKVIK
jgi:hypothetical protein